MWCLAADSEVDFSNWKQNLIAAGAIWDGDTLVPVSKSDSSELLSTAEAKEIETGKTKSHSLVSSNSTGVLRERSSSQFTPKTVNPEIQLLQAENLRESCGELDFVSLFLSHFADASKILCKKVELVEDFVGFLFDLLEGKAKLPQEVSNSSGVDIQLVLTWCSWILVGGEEPNAFLKDLQSKSPSSVCNVVWESECYAYSCKTCEISPSRHLFFLSTHSQILQLPLFGLL